MFTYYLRLGLSNLRRSPVLTALMVTTLAVGVAASMSTLVVLAAMSGNPIPHKSERLFVPLLDNFADVERGPGQMPIQMTWRDVDALLGDARASRQTAVLGLGPAIESGRADLPPFSAAGIGINADFFPMFEVPFVAGGPWTAEQDQRGDRVVVIDRLLAERLFGDVEAVGQRLKIADQEYRVVGVIGHWQPLPKFYRLVGSDEFGSFEQVFLPLRTVLAAEMDPNGMVNCSSNANLEPGYAGLMNSECVWLQYWAELDSAAQRDGYADYLRGYVAEQRRLGRFPRVADDSVRLFDLMEWLQERQVVGNDNRIQTWLAFLFLLVCLINTVGLLLAKFSARSGEIGVRRALGASRIELFKQFMTESAVVGLAGGLAGLLLTLAVLSLFARQSETMAQLARMNPSMLMTTFALAVGAALLAGLLPTWRACRVLPAAQLKTQ
jgi:putative ABC transport system permease protein